MKKIFTALLLLLFVASPAYAQTTKHKIYKETQKVVGVCYDAPSKCYLLNTVSKTGDGWAIELLVADKGNRSLLKAFNKALKNKVVNVWVDNNSTTEKEDDIILDYMVRN